MAKKIIVNNPQEASKVLKRANIEHVLVEYPGETPNTKGDAFLVVKNKDQDDVKAALTKVDFHIHRTKSVRHYEMTALRFDTGHFVPTFTCKCRNCGETFSSPVKEAVWCSIDCRKEFRNKRREAKKLEAKKAS